MNTTRRYIILFITLVVLVVVGYIFTYNYFNSTELTISTKNIESYTIKLSTSTISSSTDKTTTVRVPKLSTVSVDFKGTNGYETGRREITVGQSSESVSIEPFYSKEHLAELASSEKTQLDTATLQYKSSITTLYSIKSHKLYHFGEWASVTLVWKGEYSQNSDDLKVILKKEGKNWKIVGEPSILFFYKNYPDIPVDVLRGTNTSS